MARTLGMPALPDNAVGRHTKDQWAKGRKSGMMHGRHVTDAGILEGDRMAGSFISRGFRGRRQMDPAVAEPVAEPGAGDEQHGVGDGVAGDDQLEVGTRGFQVGTDRGGRDVHDEDVQQCHELGGEHDRQQAPGPIVSARVFTGGRSWNRCGIRARPG